MNSMVKNLLLWLALAVILVVVYQSFNPRGSTAQQMPYSDFVQQVQNDNVSKVTISSNMPANIKGQLKDGSSLKTVAPYADDSLIPTLLKHDVQVQQQPSDNG